MIGDTLNIKYVRAHWDETLRLAASIKQGTVTASLILRVLFVQWDSGNVWVSYCEKSGSALTNSTRSRSFVVMEVCLC